MLTTLPESGRALRRRPAHPAHSAISVAAHAAIAVALVGADRPVAAPPGRAERVTYVAPPFRVVSAPPAEPSAERSAAAARPAPRRAPAGATRFRAPAAVPAALPPVPSLALAGLVVEVAAPAPGAPPPPSADELAPEGTDARLAEALRGYAALPGSWADLVERGLVPDAANPRPEYPGGLLARAVEGAVRVAFVVDSSGRVDPGSLRVLRSSDELFTRAVRRVLPRLRYRPALAGPRPVAVLVEQQFTFALR